MRRRQMLGQAVVLCLMGIGAIVWSGRLGTADDVKLVFAGAAIAWGTALAAYAVEHGR